MKVAFRKSFARDLKKINDRKLREQVHRTILGVESAANLGEIRDLKKIVGTEKFYRIRIGEFRIGLIAESEIVEFVRCLPRRDLYRYSP
jgi:mRNA interferase RelE/StbE